jgi:hypothetical protein
LRIRGSIHLKRLIEWTFYSENILKCISRITNYFTDISIVEFYDNNYKLKIRKNNNSSSIGFLFGFVEDQKIECNIAEYSIAQTSLEQIFNKFAMENNEEVLMEKAKKEIKVTREYLSYLGAI